MTDQYLREMTVLSAFSGAGGLDLGLEAAGFRTVGCLENDDDARRVIANNRPEWPLLEPRDVVSAGKSLRPQDLGLQPRELTLVAGGPPCQPFSKAAQWTRNARMGMTDPRGQAVLGMLDLVGSFLPQVMLIENVAGFLRGPVSAKDAIETRLKEINREHDVNYVLQQAFVDAAWYGVPQRRQRVIAVAFRDGRELQLPAATHESEPMTAWDALHDVGWSEPPEAAGAFSDLLPSIPEGGNYLWLTDRGGGENLFGYRTRYWSFLLKLARDKPAWTLPASPGPSTGPFHWDNRALTARERMRLQSFPDDWVIEAAARPQVRLIGNATPPLLAEVVGRYIRAELDPASARALSHVPTLLRRRAGAPPPPTPPQPVPERHLHRVGEHPAHAGTGRGPAPRQART